MFNYKLIIMKKKLFLLAVTLFIFSVSVQAQEKWSVEFRPGLNFPTGDLGDTNTKIGFGFEFTGAYKIMPHLAVYAGWGWNQFKGEESLSADDITFEETGYTFGLQLLHPIGTSSFSYFGRAGAIYNHIELENNAGDITADTGHGFGWQVGAGIDYEFADNLSLRPELRYRSLKRDIEIANTTTDLDLNYISFGVGLVWAF